MLNIKVNNVDPLSGVVARAAQYKLTLKVEYLFSIQSQYMYIAHGKAGKFVSHCFIRL